MSGKACSHQLSQTSIRCCYKLLQFSNRQVEMNTESTSSPAERVYAAVIAVVVPLVIGAIWFSNYLRDGRLDTALMKSEAIYYLAYIGVASIAMWVGVSLLSRVAIVFTSALIRSLCRFGIPLFLFTTCFNWVFPSHLRLSEHVFTNLILALFVSWTWRGATKIEIPSGG